MQLVMIKKVLTQQLPVIHHHLHVCQELCYPNLVVLPLPNRDAVTVD